MDVRSPDLAPHGGVTREQVTAAMAEGPDAVLALVAGAVAAALAPVLARLAALEAARAKDSHNSSKPPSTDVTRTGRAPKRLRGKSGRGRGGQPGHPGRTLALRATPDVVAVHARAACRACGAAVGPAAPSTPVLRERRRVFELPPVALTCTEHRVAERACAGCGAVSRGAYPPEARSTAQYGPGLLGFGLYLTAYQLLPVARAAAAPTALTGQRVSPATLRAAEARGAAALAPVLARTHAGLARSAVLHPDGTAFYVGDLAAGGPCARWWLHVACTPTLTHYAAHPRRGTTAHAAVGLLPTYAGTAVHDGYASYRMHAGCRHALCGAHLRRAPAARTCGAHLRRAPAARTCGAS